MTLPGLAKPAAVAFLVAAALAGGRLAAPIEIGPPPWEAAPFSAPQSALDRALLLHDGQTYAALALDPLLTGSDRFYGDERNHAFRAGRPMVPFLAWALSLGRGGWVPEAMLALTVLGIVALVLAAARAAEGLGRDPTSAWLVLAVPGTLATAAYIGLTDAWATAAALAGLVAWDRGRTSAAIVLLAVAVLFRETGLLAIAAVLLVDRRRAAPVLWSVLPYGIWTIYVRVQLGHWTLTSDPSGSSSSVPFGGWWRGARSAEPVWWLVLVVTLGIVALGLPRLRGPLRAYALLWVVFAPFLGWWVWTKWFDFPRVLLPLGIVCALPLLPRSSATPLEPSGAA